MHRVVSLIAAVTLMLLASSALGAPNIRLTSDGGSSVRPRVALDPSGNAVVVWQDSRFGNDEILWQKFDQLGNALGPVVRVTNSSGASRHPDIACDPAGVSHVTWQEGENVNGVGTVFFCRLDAGGTKILNDVQIPVGLCGQPRVSALADGSTDLAFFRSSGVIDFHTLYRRYSPTGAFVCTRQLGSSSTATVLSPTIATSTAGIASVFWLDIPTSSYQVKSTSVPSGCGSSSLSTIAGASATTKTTTAYGGPFWFRMFDGGGNIQNVLGPSNVCQISQGAGQASAPSVGADATNGYVVWRDNRDGGSGEIYFARFWSCEQRSGDVRLTSDPAASVEPDIAVEPSGSGNWVAVWRDGRDGNNEIYLTSQAGMDTPGAPSNFVADLVDCPPRAALSWQDNSTSETSFAIEMEENGSGTWLPVVSPPADATSATSGPLNYGSSYVFRIKACNGAACSSWSPSDPLNVPSPLQTLTVTVRGTVVERPYVTTPTSQPLGRIQVLVRRGTTDIASGETSEAGSVTLSGPFECSDSVVASLENSRLKVSDEVPPQQNCKFDSHPSVMLTRQVGFNQSLDLAWPTEGDGTSGDAVNLFYLAEKCSREFWENQVAVTPGPLWSVIVDRPTGLGATTGRSVQPLSACSNFSPGLAKISDAVYHELGHRMAIQATGRLLGLGDKNDADQSWAYPEATSMDEGFADYFTAAFTGDNRIHSWNGNNVYVLRNLHQTLPMLYPTCDADLAYDSYYGGKVFGGALWDLRTNLINGGITATAIDQAIYAALTRLGGVEPPEVRTFLAYRDLLIDSDFGRTHASTIESAFARHNISDDPFTFCTPTTIINAIVREVEETSQVVTIRWSKAVGSVRDRLYVLIFPRSDVNFSYGTLVADSLTDSSYVYTHPDTSAQLAFVVTAIDSSGNEGASSRETPAVLAVPTLQAAHYRLDAYPNPANGTVRFRLGAGWQGRGTLQVFDIAGRLVQTIEVKASDADESHDVVWNAEQAGRRLRPGVYLVRFRQGENERTTKVVLTL